MEVGCSTGVVSCLEIEAEGVADLSVETWADTEEVLSAGTVVVSCLLADAEDEWADAEEEWADAGEEWADVEEECTGVEEGVLTSDLVAEAEEETAADEAWLTVADLDAEAEALELDPEEPQLPYRGLQVAPQ